MSFIPISTYYELKIVGYEEGICDLCGAPSECATGLDWDGKIKNYCFNCVSSRWGIQLFNCARKKYNIMRKTDEMDTKNNIKGM